MNSYEKTIKPTFVFDAHCDTANVLYDQSSYFINKKNSHLTLPKAKAGGLNAQIFALFVNPIYAPNRALKKGLLLYQTLETKLFSSKKAEKVTTTTEMLSALKNNKLACWLSLESGDIIENSLNILELFHTLGIRIMTLTHTKNTDWADSSNDKPEHDGLTTFGKKIITKMNKLPMVIDVSHASDKTVEDVLETTTHPIMASHSCARTLCDIPRNLPDDLIKEIADKKGFIGVNFFPGFLKKTIYNQIQNNIKKYATFYDQQIKGKQDDPDSINKVEMQLYLKTVQGLSKIDLKPVIDHIIHIAEVGGIDCVGLGSDFDGIPSTPTDLTDVTCYPQLAQKLYETGFGNHEVNKIMGMNLFNFLKKFENNN